MITYQFYLCVRHGMQLGTKEGWVVYCKSVVKFSIFHIKMLIHLLVVRSIYLKALYKSLHQIGFFLVFREFQ